MIPGIKIKARNKESTAKAIKHLRCLLISKGAVEVGASIMFKTTNQKPIVCHSIKFI